MLEGRMLVKRTMGWRRIHYGRWLDDRKQHLHWCEESRSR